MATAPAGITKALGLNAPADRVARVQEDFARGLKAPCTSFRGHPFPVSSSFPGRGSADLTAWPRAESCVMKPRRPIASALPNSAASASRITPAPARQQARLGLEVADRVGLGAAVEIGHDMGQRPAWARGTRPGSGLRHDRDPFLAPVAGSARPRTRRTPSAPTPRTNSPGRLRLQRIRDPGRESRGRYRRTRSMRGSVGMVRPGQLSRSVTHVRRSMSRSRSTHHSARFAFGRSENRTVSAWTSRQAPSRSPSR